MNKRVTTVLWGLLIGIFIFHGVLENIVLPISVFDESIGLLCFPLAIFDYFKNRTGQQARMNKSRRMELLLLAAFFVCGLLGNIIYRYQPAWVVLLSAVLAAKFFMILLSAGYIQKYWGLQLEEQELMIQILSLLWFAYFGLSQLWPQYFPAPEAWDVCAKSALLFALLIFCEHKKVWLYRICLFLMVFMLVLSGKEKAYGAILLAAVLYYLIVHKKVQTKVRYILYLAVPVVLLGWEKIYYYYIEGHGRYAKSVMTGASLQIMRDYFPIGTGFGTFGSTYAMKQYSPVYYMYGIAENPELGVESKKYLTDLFWPILFGETGVLGTLIYCALILLLFLQIQRIYFYNKKKYFLLIYLFIFMLMTTFTEAGFMQPMVMIYAFVMGILLEEYEEKRSQKMKYFE